ncbi:MAG: alpha-ketoacid dehydrogenase subunit beta [Xenococcaceae cyanobacterium]
MQNQTTFANAIKDALVVAMENDPSVICYGLGSTDPKGIFGTTLGLEQKFGKERVFDMPTSENAMTGVAVGASLNGIKSVMTHQRLDFFLLALDQLVNSAAKWHYTFNQSVPITIRLIIGRGWGQGPTHSQNLQAWFAHVPGLKVVMPSTPSDAKGLLLASIFDPNPVVFLEHRWLHNSIGNVPQGDFRIPIGKANTVHTGSDVTIISMSYLTLEAIYAANYLSQHGVSCEVIDLRTLKPLDWDTLYNSVSKTGRVLVLDTGVTTGSVAGEIVARIAMDIFESLKIPPSRLAMPDVPEPAGFSLTKGFYIRAHDIICRVCAMLGLNDTICQDAPKEPEPHDIPGDWFTGPF